MAKLLWSQRKKIGAGSFGKVYKCPLHENETLTFVAVKVLHNDDIDSFNAETSNYCKINHENIIKFLGTVEIPHEGLAIQMELADEGSLEKHFKSLTPIQISMISLDIARGLEYLHGKQLVHRDIKLSNVLLVGNLSSLKFKAKLSDFGQLKRKETVMSVLKGTAEYMAPEVAKSNTYTFSADLYSFSIILFELYSATKFPYTCNVRDWHGVYSFVNEIAMKPKPQIPMSCPDDVKDLISRGWSNKVEERPQLDEFISSFVKGTTDNQLIEVTESDDMLNIPEKLEK